MFSTSLRTIDFCTIEMKCAYLSSKRARMRYKYIKGATSKHNDNLTHRGWRRFGEYYSKPQCNLCNECLSMRIDAQNFKFSRNDKRTLKKNLNTKVFMRQPTVTQEHLDLYNLYHEAKKEEMGWTHYKLSLQHYYELYVAGHGSFGKEILYFVEDKLVAVDLIDFLEDGISSIYCFYDPNYRYLSLGRYSLYQQILLCKAKKLRWIYIGYYVQECPSLSYKSNYKPYELMQNDPGIKTSPIWK